MAAPKGTRPPNAGKGRKKGSLNRNTGAIKDMILGALSDVGGQEYLAEQARANPSAFLTLVGKVLPMQVQGTLGLSEEFAALLARGRARLLDDAKADANSGGEASRETGAD